MTSAGFAASWTSVCARMAISSPKSVATSWAWPVHYDMVVITEDVLYGPHLTGELAWRAVGKLPEVVDEMRLVGIPELVGQHGQAPVRVEHQPLADFLEADRASQRLR